MGCSVVTKGAVPNPASLWEFAELWELTWVKYMGQTHSYCVRIQIQTWGKAVHCRGREGDVELFKRELYLNIKGRWEALGGKKPMKTSEIVPK